MFVEPLLICPRSKYLNMWQHPEIVELTKDLEKTSVDTLRGELIRVDLKFDEHRVIHIICATDKQGVKEVMTETGMPEYLGRLSILLTQPVWLPGGEQFVETEFGQLFQRIFPMYDEDFHIAVSQNVSLATDGENWWFGTYNIESKEGENDESV